jgi:hypothetical protein
VVGLALVCLAVATMLPAAVLTFQGNLSWPNWVGLLWVLSLPLGVASLVVLLVARRSIRRAQGNLRGLDLVGEGLLMAGMGACVNSVVFLVGAWSASGGQHHPSETNSIPSRRVPASPCSREAPRRRSQLGKLPAHPKLKPALRASQRLERVFGRFARHAPQAVEVGDAVGGGTLT